MVFDFELSHNQHNPAPFYRNNPLNLSPYSRFGNNPLKSAVQACHQTSISHQIQNNLY